MSKEKNYIEANWLELLVSAYSKLRFKKIDFCLIVIIIMLSITLFNINQEINSEHLMILIQIYTSLLGFGIGGFAIFATTSNKDYIARLMNFKSKNNSNFGLYKVHMLVMSKFIICLALSLITLCFFYFILEYQKNELFSELIYDFINTFHLNYSQCFTVINTSVSFILGLIIGASLIELKNFVFNIYNMSINYANYVVIEKNKEQSDTNN